MLFLLRYLTMSFMILSALPSFAAERWIIKTDGQTLTQEQLDAQFQETGTQLRLVRQLFGNNYLIEQLSSAREKLKPGATTPTLQPSVKGAVAIEIDQILNIQQAPADSRYLSDQWYLHQREDDSSSTAINAERLWRITTGSRSTVVAVLDTGILADHYEFNGVNILPGADLISNTAISNDGDGRDLDPTDPGDGQWFSASSWHGTAVTSLITANMDNREMSGLTPNVSLLPVRVLGVGGGYTSDIIDGMLWAAGEPVDGLPINPTPAHVLNLSLGGLDFDGKCESYWQDAIHYLTREKGVIIVVAAGNSNLEVKHSIPANCEGVVSVAATTQGGHKASFSNYGPAVTVAAPGEHMLVAGNLGTRSAGEHTTYFYDGTSFAAPLVSAAIAAWRTFTPSPSTETLKSLLASSTLTFNNNSSCLAYGCGAGIIDPVTMILTSDPTVEIENLPPSVEEINESLYIVENTIFDASRLATASDQETLVERVEIVFEDQTQLVSPFDGFYLAPDLVTDEIISLQFRIRFFDTQGLYSDSAVKTVIVFDESYFNTPEVTENEQEPIHAPGNKTTDDQTSSDESLPVAGSIDGWELLIMLSLLAMRYRMPSPPGRFWP